MRKYLNWDAVVAYLIPAPIWRWWTRQVYLPVRRWVRKLVAR